METVPLREFREMLLQKLDITKELTDREILDAIDALILIDNKDHPLTLRQKVRLRDELFSSVRKLDVLQDMLDDYERMSAQTKS